MSTSLPDTIKAAQRILTGRKEAVIQVDSDVPLSGLAANLPDEHVLVNVHFTALNPIDLKFPEHPVISKFLKTTIPCLDFAGTVASSSSSRFTTGDAIFGQTQPPNFGACAEYVVVGAQHCAKVPEGVELQDAATIGIAGLMAYQSIVPYAKAKDRVFINGGSGGVGTYGIQIARAVGCSVIVACSDVNAELCKRLGAEKVIDYRTQDVAKALEESNEQFDLIIDNVFSDLDVYWTCHKFLQPKGRYITTAVRPEMDFAWNALKVYLWPAILGGGQRQFGVAARKSNTSDYEQIATWVQNGTITPIIERVYDLEDIAEAFKRLRSGRTRGKLVVKISERPRALHRVEGCHSQRMM
jgi:NADPH:quinone reductase-like Zn-dependent oxidoreductase